MRQRALIILAVVAGLATLLLGVAAVGPFIVPEWFRGTPRNQWLESNVVEQKARLGMTMPQVELVLHLPVGTMMRYSRRAPGGGTEVEIVGSSPPWRSLPNGCHSLALTFDSRGRLASGFGIWYCPNEDDSDRLELE